MPHRGLTSVYEHFKWAYTTSTPQLVNWRQN